MMGSACSMSRSSRDETAHRGGGAGRNRRGGANNRGKNSSGGDSGLHSSLRHSVVTTIPDRCIAKLYPMEENYILEPDGTKSPKSLAELATDAVCRSLVYLDGALPPGLPPDVVADIVESLTAHSAWTPTTLQVLQQCELPHLDLTTTRGVTDEWIHGITTTTISPPTITKTAAATANHHHTATTTTATNRNMKESCTPNLVLVDSDNPRMSDMLSGNYSATAAVAASAAHHHHHSSDGAVLLPTMEMDHDHHDQHQHHKTDADDSESACSTASFMTATSNPYAEMPTELHEPLLGTATTSESASTTHNNTATNNNNNNNSHSHSSNPEGMIIEQEEFYCHDTTAAAAAAAKTTGHHHDEDDDDHDFAGNQKPMADRFGGSSATTEWTAVTTRMMTHLDLSGSQHLTDKGLSQLSRLEQLQEARLEHCHAITGRGLAIFASSLKLQTLSLAHCRRLTDESCNHLSHLLSLEWLSLAGCRCLTDRSIAALADLYSLRHLDVSQCDLLTDAAVHELEHLQALEQVNLGWCRQITNAGLRTLCSQAGRSDHLRRLCLARCSLTDAGVASLSRLLALEDLNLNGCAQLGSTALGNAIQYLPRLATLEVSYCPGILRSGWQGKIDHVKCLDLCYSTVRDSHIRRLVSLPALEELNLDSCPAVADASIRHLTDNDVVPNLKRLDLSDTNITDLSMSHIAKLKHLTHLSLFYCNVTNRGLRHVAKLQELQVLNLDSRDVTDEGIFHIRDLPKLKSLDVFSGRITDAGCEHISRLQTLESLELCGGGVADTGCVALAKLTALTHLNLSQNEGISNQGASVLAASLSNLKTLNLSNTCVTSGALRYFTGLSQLESLALYGCSGMEYSVRLDWLKSRLPNLKCLRLNNTSEEEGMVLVDISEESSSEEERWSSNRNSLMGDAAMAGGTHDDDDDDDDENVYSDRD